MPRTARIDIPGILYHVIARGIERRDIFIDDDDLYSFVECLSALLEKTGTTCFALALLQNHPPIASDISGKTCDFHAPTSDGLTSIPTATGIHVPGIPQ